MNEENVFIIEDNLGNLRQVSLMLKECADPVFKVTSAGRLEDALKALDAKQFDIVLMDLSDSRGLAGLEKLTCKKDMPPVVVLTGLEDENTGLEALRKRASDYLMKDQITANALTRSIRYALERRRAENALRESETRYRIVADFTYDWEFWIGPDGRFEYVSPSVERVTGRPASSGMMAEAFLKLAVHPEDLERCVEHVREHLAAQGFGDMEFRIVRPDGEARWMHYVCQPVSDAHGRFLGIRGSNRDITERKRAEEMLQAALLRTHHEKAKTEAIIAAVGDGISIQDREFRVLFQNEAHEKMAGKHLGEYCYQAYEHRDGTCDACPVALSFKDGQVHRSERTVVAGNVTRHIEIISSPLKDANGAIVAGIEAARDITERKKIEKNLEDSEVRFRRLFEAAQDGVLILDAESGQINEVNPFLINLLGYSHEEFCGKKLWETGAFVDIEKSKAAFQKLKTTGFVRYEDLPLQTKNGRLINVEFVSNVYKVDHTEVIQCNIRDITARKQAEEKLLRSEERLRLAQLSANVGVWDWDLLTGKLFFTPENEHLYGLASGTVKVYQDFRDRVHPDDIAGVEIEREKAIADRKSFDLEFRVFYPSGDVHWLSSRGGAVYNDAGTAVRVFGVDVDITAHKRVEEKLSLINQRLELAQQAAGAGSWDWDLSTGHLDWGKKLFELFGLDPDKTVASFDIWEGLIYPEDRQIAKEQMDHAMRCHALLASEYRILLKDGQVRWINALGRTLYDAAERPIRMAGICIDVTERKQAEEILKRDKETFETLITERTRELLEARMSLVESKRLSDIGTLAATVAHELRNPLGVIRLAVFNIKKGDKDSVFTKSLENIEKKIIESEQIIRNLLSYSRVKAPKFEKVIIQELFEEILEMAHAKYLQWDVKIQTHYDNSVDGFIEADRVQMAQLFSNLLDNACQALPHKKGNIQILVRLDRERNLFSVILKDDGMGMDEDVLSKIFEPFFTQKTRGVGLGLTVCKQIVELHGGTLDFKSKKGEGTEVYVALSIQRAVRGGGGVDNDGEG